MNITRITAPPTVPRNKVGMRISVDPSLQQQRQRNRAAQPSDRYEPYSPYGSEHYESPRFNDPQKASFAGQPQGYGVSGMGQSLPMQYQNSAPMN